MSRPLPRRVRIQDDADLDAEEEALLREQEEFLASKKKPSVTIVKTNAATQDKTELSSQATGAKPMSHFAQMRQKQRAKAQDQGAEEQEGDEKVNTNFRDPMSVVRMPVVERDPSLVPVVAPTLRTTPFPEAKPRHLLPPKTLQPSKLSETAKEAKDNGANPTHKLVGLPSRQEIHEENLARLGAMSAEEKRELQACVSACLFLF
jgi:hypothetical protein